MPSSSSTVSVIVRGLCVLAIAGIGAMVYYAITIQKWSSAEISFEADPGALAYAKKAGKVFAKIDLQMGLKSVCSTIEERTDTSYWKKDTCTDINDFMKVLQCNMTNIFSHKDAPHVSGVNKSFVWMILGCVLFGVGFVSQPIIMCYDRAGKYILLRLLPRLAIAAAIAACSVALANYHYSVRNVCGSEDLCTTVNVLGKEIVQILNFDNDGDVGSGSGSCGGSGSGEAPCPTVSPPSITCTLNSQCFIMATASCVLATIVLVLNFIFVGKPTASVASTDENTVLLNGGSGGGGVIESEQQNYSLHSINI